MSTKKTIQINPELFKMPGNKTKKNRERMAITLKPVVSPSNLKNKLLSRIKEHKTNELKETKSKETKSKESNSKESNTNIYTDEFYGAIDYLSALKHKQTQQRILHNKTLKQQSNPNIVSNPTILLDLPPELQEPSKTSMVNNELFKINYKPNDDVPYGCLKNGKKKTYREWKDISSPSIYPELPDLVRPPTPPKKSDGVFFTSIKDNNTITQQEPINSLETTSREDRLKQLKHKLQKLEDQETSTKRQTIEAFNKMEKKILMPFEDKLLSELPDFEDKQSNLPDIEEIFKQREEAQPPKQYLKKTIKRRFTLGKSDKLKRISILIKDKQTRKNIINTQKSLKNTDITDVKKYLRQHGIIKVGSTCPTDILRKTFESAVLTGEVTNTNKETLLHNFLNGE